MENLSMPGFKRLADPGKVELLAEADRLRKEAFGNTVELCAIVNIKSGNCGMDCKFCSQSRVSRMPVRAYNLLDEQNLASAIMKLASGPYKHIGLVASGGYLGPDELDRLVGIIEKMPPAIVSRLCASLGRLDARSLAKLKKAGIRRYHHNLETSSEYYPRICSSQSWNARRDTVLRALDAGLEVCSGGIFGLGESMGQRVDLARELSEIGVQNLPLNFLHPQPGTPLGDRKPLEAGECLRIIATFRLVLPKATLRVCGGRPLCLANRQDEMFAAGANALMSGDYLTTKGHTLANDLAMLKKLGLEPVS